ncbi:MAG: hypothetical protein FDW93_00775 [Bergeyella sp.]|nr:hypothetical protein [Bergeyella sp.]
MNTNAVELVVKMKDLMSRGLVRLSQNSTSAFGKITQKAKTLAERNKAVAEAFGTATRKAKELENTVKSSGVEGKLRTIRQEIQALHNVGRGGGMGTKGAMMTATGIINTLANSTILFLFL